MLVAQQHSSFALQQTDQWRFQTSHTHGPWSDTPTLHQPGVFSMRVNSLNMLKGETSLTKRFSEAEEAEEDHNPQFPPALHPPCHRTAKYDTEMKTNEIMKQKHIQPLVMNSARSKQVSVSSIEGRFDQPSWDEADHHDCCRVTLVSQ